MRLRWILLAALLIGQVANCPTVAARTWYVNEEGTGDAPTIPAAMDSAAYGDTVLVAPGAYTCQVEVPAAVTLKSEMGAEATFLNNSVVVLCGMAGRLEGFTLVGGGSAVECWSALGFAIRDNIIKNSGGSAVFCNDCVGEVIGNTIVDNQGAAIYLSMCFVEVRCNLCVDNGEGIISSESDDHLIECNDSWGNMAFNFIGIDDVGGQGNFSEDPLFCEPGAGDWALHSSSPCLPGNHPNGFNCGLIGALGQGCDGPCMSVAEEGAASWTMIKALFR